MPAASSTGKAAQGRRPLKLRLLLTLYSNGNIAGCALALLGPVLLFAGVIGPGWLFITAGLYAGAGCWAGPAARRHRSSAASRTRSPSKRRWPGWTPWPQALRRTSRPT